MRRLLKALRHETPDVATTAVRLKLDPKSSDTIANVIKTYHPPNAGKLSLVRVWSGQVTEGMSLNGVRVAGVLRLLGAQSTKANSAGAGRSRCAGAARRHRHRHGAVERRVAAGFPDLADARSGLWPHDRRAKSQ